MTRLIRFAPILLWACTEPAPTGIEVPDIVEDEGCPEMFRQSVMPEYHIEISDSEWAALEDEFAHRVEREMAGLDPHPYHPVGFHYVAGSENSGPVPGVLLRLKGGSSWLQTLDLDDSPKMQFVIAFNEVDPGGRFKGVRKIELDMPRTDQSFLKQRVALSYLRGVGLPAQCANNARLYVNGEYYGLYTNLERLDKEFLQLRFPEADDGDLWKSGRIIKTNEDTFSWERLDALWHVPDLDSLAALADLDASMDEWAAEAVVGDADGYYNGRANFYLYDHPSRGFIWMPHDVDTAIDPDFLPVDATPVFPLALARWERDWHHYILAMNDPRGVAQYADALASARSRYDVAALQERVDLWSEQIAAAVAEDPRKPFGDADHLLAVSRMRDYVAGRADYMDSWLACWDSGGDDVDGDGFDMCHDCDDSDQTVRPGAPELCNLRDDDCDGHADTIGGVTVCE